MTHKTYAILTVVFLSLSLIGAIILVKRPQDTRNLAQADHCSQGIGGGCGNASNCCSWEVYENGCCHSTSGCSQDSDCLSGKRCVNRVCEGGTTPTCDQCSPISDDNKKCFGTTEKHCGNDGCWHYDPAKNDNAKCANSTPVPTSDNSGGQSGSPQCASSPDSGCSTGGKGGVDCADCRRTNGQVKQCTDGVWYCCYGDGLCYSGNSSAVTCTGSTITNNTKNSLSGNIYRGCETGDKIGSFTLAPGQSKSADKCTQIDIPNYCGAPNCDSSCQNTPPTLPAKATATAGPTATRTPTNIPTNTPTNTPTPTGTLIPTNTPTNTPTPTPTNTPVPNSTNTPTPTATPTSTIDNRQSNSPVPTRIILPEAGVDLPSRFLLIFGSVITLIGFLVLI